YDNLDHIYYRIQTQTGKLVSVEDFGMLVEEEGERPVFHVFVYEMTEGYSVDWLTGLPDMNRFHEAARACAAEIERRGQRPAAIALDLMGLKAFNAQYGRDQGDVLLCAFAGCLGEHFGADRCSRFAEDHFYTFAPEDAVQEKLQELFEDFKHANGGRVIPVRAGVYVCHEGEDIAAVGTDRAKIACDLDRKTWESHITYFDDDMRTAEKRRIHVLESIDCAIEEGWVRPHYQAIVRASTSDLCAEEALARWNDPEYGMLSPDQFVPVLEAAGLLYQLDTLIVDCVLADMNAKRARGVHAVPVSINFSRRDFLDLDIAEMLAKKTEACRVPRDLINVEVIESVASSCPKRFKNQVDALHEAGFKVWLDDFGSGYSSLNTLYEFDFDVVKLDMSFVHSLESNAKAREIVKGVLKTAEKLGVSTLAEGVETVEQAMFLESAGCGMLQGYLYSKPLPIEVICEHFSMGEGIPREAPEEAGYWNAIGTMQLSEITTNGNSHTIEGALLDEMPAGIVERRCNAWRVLRANAAYRDLLDQTGVLPPGHSTLHACNVVNGLDDDFFRAIAKCEESNDWEVVAGRLDYGTGYQTYVKPAVSGPYADAFHVAAFPALLGSALGPYGDVPVAYTVFRAVLNDAGDEVIDAEYVYANEVYCQWGGFDQDTLPGRSFAESWPDADKAWYPYCYRAAVLGETVHDTIYSNETGHWLNFNVVPSPVKDCCVFAFTIADAERRERAEIIARRDTSDLILEIVTELSDMMKGYDDAMNGTLEILSRIIDADRLYILEKKGRIDGRVYERCAEGIAPRISSIRKISDADLTRFTEHFRGCGIIYADKLEKLSMLESDQLAYLRYKEVESMLIVPLREGGRYVGCLGADNYSFKSNIETERLLESIAPIMGTIIGNHQLVEELEWAGTHDSLTGLLNRRGIDAAIEERTASRKGEPFVLALLDIDDFKKTNDLYGHSAGDEALRTLARAMRDVFSKEAVLGRNGGDELLIMLFGDDANRADELFESFTRGEISFKHEDNEYFMTTSIGYAGCPSETDSVAQAYIMADAALYAVKLAGKSRSMRYSRDASSQYRSQLGFTPRDIAENIPGAVMVHRAGGNGEILFANNAMIELLGCASLEEFMKITDGIYPYVVHPADRVHVYEEITEQIKLDEIGKKTFVNYRVVTKNGTVKNVVENAHLVDIDGIGKVFYVLIIDLDEHDSRHGRNPVGNRTFTTTPNAV
ncbi:MAG: EAL domain-containing protein, partial [Eggerthellaceae bacterium]|nr:EAL domain-containing protein [Eggerthellaceae bacterium]